MQGGIKKLARALAIGSVVALTAAPVMVIADASNPMYAPKKKKAQAKPRTQAKPRAQTKAKAHAKPMVKTAKMAPANDFVPSYSPPNPAPMPVAQPVYTPPVPVASAPISTPVMAAAPVAAPVAKAGTSSLLLGALALAGIIGGGLLIADASDEDQPVSP